MNRKRLNWIGKQIFCFLSPILLLIMTCVPAFAEEQKVYDAPRVLSVGASSITLAQADPADTKKADQTEHGSSSAAEGSEEHVIDRAAVAVSGQDSADTQGDRSDRAEDDPANAELSDAARSDEAVDGQADPDLGTDVGSDTRSADPNAFTVPGNGAVRDQIEDGSTKEFYTITTANNNTFYLVIDHASAIDNVYLLSQIDENDLKDFVDVNEVEGEIPPSASVILEDAISGNGSGLTGTLDLSADEETLSTDPEDRGEKEEEKDALSALHKKGIWAGILIVVGIVVGILVFVTMILPNRMEDDDASENMETENFDSIKDDEEGE